MISISGLGSSTALKLIDATRDKQLDLMRDSAANKRAEEAFRDRIGDISNPEELIGAAHAGCFSMAFSLELGNAGYTADSIDTKAKVTLDKDGDGFSITKIHLDMNAKIPGIDDAEFQKIANGAKEGCPVSKVLNAEITLDAKLG